MPPDATEIALLTRDLIDAVATHADESHDIALIRAETAMAQIEALAPQDPMEVFLAGQIVLFQTLILDAVKAAHAAASPESASKLRQQTIALGRIQASHLAELRRHRAAAAKALAAQAAEAEPDEDAPPPPAHPFDPPFTPDHPQPPGQTAPKAAGSTGPRAQPTRHAAAAMRWT